MTFVRLSQPLLFACLLKLLLATGRVQAALPIETLEKGIYTEETKGDLAGAIQLYRTIVADPSADRSLAAQAQLRLGLCQLKLGNKAQAVSALERLTQEFPDKEKLLAMVEKQMPLLLDEIVRQIEQNYIKEIDRTELMQTAILAIVGKLDKESDYLGEKQLVQVNQQLDQRIAGIGAALKFDKETRQVIVQAPLAGSPALRAGLRVGDRIVEIDGRPADALPKGRELEAAVELIRGPTGDPVTLGIQREGADRVENVTIVRDTVHLPTVLGDRYKADNTWEFMLDDQRKIGYLRLTQLAHRSPEEMSSALTELTNRGMKALILDLRNNPGGLLSEAVAVSDMFLENGTIVSLKGRTGNAQTFEAKKEGTFPAFPMALLVNRRTASAAEIIAACLQDHQRAVVIGERTYGEGLVKSLIHLKGSNSALKLPTSAYYRPSGKNMHRYPESTEADDWGVKPDAGYEVLFSDEELKLYGEYRMKRDIVTARSTADFHDRQLETALTCLAAEQK